MPPQQQSLSRIWCFSQFIISLMKQMERREPVAVPFFGVCYIFNFVTCQNPSGWIAINSGQLLYRVWRAAPKYCLTNSLGHFPHSYSGCANPLLFWVLPCHIKISFYSKLENLVCLGPDEISLQSDVLPDWGKVWAICNLVEWVTIQPGDLHHRVRQLRVTCRFTLSSLNLYTPFTFFHFI